MRNDAAGFAMDEMRPRFERIANRHENGTAPRAVSTYQLFQTPTALAARLVALIGTPARCLEPSAGLGRLLDHITSPCVAVEIAPQLAAELFRQNRPNVTLKQRDFLAIDPAELGQFEGVAMNPPFHMRADIRHVLHARQFLAPGGTLAALCLDTPHRETALRHLCSTWEKIEAGAFRAEGTGVACILLTIHA
jgi:hypothetical protein